MDVDEEGGCNKEERWGKIIFLNVYKEIMHHAG